MEETLELHCTSEELNMLCNIKYMFCIAHMQPNLGCFFLRIMHWSKTDVYFFLFFGAQKETTKKSLITK